MACRITRGKQYCQHCVKPIDKKHCKTFGSDVIQYLQNNPLYDITQNLGELAHAPGHTISWLVLALLLKDFALLDELLSDKRKGTRLVVSTCVNGCLSPLQMLIGLCTEIGSDAVKQYIVRLLDFGLKAKALLPLESPFPLALQYPLPVAQDLVLFLLQVGFTAPYKSEAFVLKNLHPIQDQEKLIWTAQNLLSPTSNGQAILSEYFNRQIFYNFSTVFKDDCHKYWCWFKEVYTRGFQSLGKEHHSNDLLAVHLQLHVWRSTLCIEKLWELGAIDPRSKDAGILLETLFTIVGDMDILHIMKTLYSKGFVFPPNTLSYKPDPAEQSKLLTIYQCIAQNQPDFDWNYVDKTNCCPAICMSYVDLVLFLLQCGTHPNHQTSMLTKSIYTLIDGQPLKLLKMVSFTRLPSKDNYKLNALSWMNWVHLFTFGFRVNEIPWERERLSVQNSLIYRFWREHCWKSRQSLFLLAFDAVHREHRNFFEWKVFFGPTLAQMFVEKRNTLLTQQCESNWSLLKPYLKNKPVAKAQ